MIGGEVVHVQIHDGRNSFLPLSRCLFALPPSVVKNEVFISAGDAGSAWRWLWLIFLLKLEDARVALMSHFGKHEEIVATEALRRLPLIAVLV